MGLRTSACAATSLSLDSSSYTDSNPDQQSQAGSLTWAVAIAARSLSFARVISKLSVSVQMGSGAREGSGAGGDTERDWDGSRVGLTQ